ncbi:MAG: methylated-DNA--[protein]-cysteine S-methyltransferase, partial [Gemmataceae bacterium]
MNIILTEHTLETPVGILTILTEGKWVRAIDFDGYDSRLNQLLQRHYGTFERRSATIGHDAVQRLSDYFAGDLAAIEPIPTATAGTVFQKAVWAALRTVSKGTTASYGEIAAKIGRPAACRAVGLANGANPIAIIV